MMKNILKKILVLSFFLFFALRVFAPTHEFLILPSISPASPFTSLIQAIGMVESQYDTLAYNPLEQASGYFQIRPIRLTDYNIRTGSTYKVQDLFTYNISEKIFLYYAAQIGPYNFERIARMWNGSGASTALYWEQVKKYLPVKQ